MPSHKVNKDVKRDSSREDEPMVRVQRQREMVETMKHENEVLRLELTRESRDARKATSSSGAADIQRLQDDAARYLKKIEKERSNIEELDRSIAQYQEKILDQKCRLGGVNAAQENNKLVQMQIRVLENRLDKNLMKFNETLGQNKALRMKIDEYRRERVVFDGIYKKLERELHEKKKEMAAIIEDSKNAYQARDKSQSELLALQQNADKERSAFESEFKEMGEMIRAQQAEVEKKRLEQFDRKDDDMLTKNQLKDGASGKAITDGSTWGNNTGTAAPLSQENIHSYEDALLRIQEGTGIYDIDEIVTRFLEAEEQNFSLFNYVNDINTEIERLEHNISDMRNQIEKYRGQGMSTDTQRRKLAKDLQEKLERTKKQTEEYEVRYQTATRTITQLKNGIHQIFTRIGAANQSVDEMLGNQGVTETNMLQYLGIIEQRTSEILQQFAATQIGAGLESTLQLPSVVAAEKNAQLSVQPPSYDEMSDGENSEGEEDERPLTRSELEKRTQSSVSRKGTMQITM
jgi:chromosome segregation ATPase